MLGHQRGRFAGRAEVSIKRDATAPSVSYSSAAAPGPNGWYTSESPRRSPATDALSGPASDTKTATSSGKGNAVTVDSPAFTDNAGNTAVLRARSFQNSTSAPNTPLRPFSAS